MSESVRRFGGLALLPFISLLIPFLILPIISRIATQEEVAALGVGDSVGAMVALVGAYGWPLVGPARVANLTSTRAIHSFGESLVPRLLILFAALIPGCILAAVLVGDAQIPIALTAVFASGVGALSPAWFLVGRSRPGLIAIYDTIPRAVAGLVAVVLVLVTENVIWYPISLLVGTLLGYLAYLWRTRAIYWFVKRSSWRRAIRTLRAELSPALAMVSGGIYSSAAVSLVAIGGTVQVVAVYGMADRLFKASLIAILASTNALQGWVSEDASYASLAARGRRAVAILGGVGVIGGAGIALLAPWATGWLFTSAYAIDFFASSMLGLAFLAIALSSALGRLVLVPFGRVRLVTISTVIGALVGVPSIILGASWFGVAGAAAGFALSEMIVTLFQVCAVLRLRHENMPVVVPEDGTGDAS